MGGGGNYGWPQGGGNPDEILRKASTEEEKNSYEGQVSTYLQDLLADANDRNQEQIDAHINTIEDALNKENIGSCKLSFGGSIKKHTYVDGLSDIDVLAGINNTDLEGKSPAEIRAYFAERLRERLPNSNIEVGNLAVTVNFSDGTKVQILPSINTANGVRISNSDGKEWSSVIHPEKFADKLTNVNRGNGNGVVPVIKLTKAINSQLPEDSQLSGYHIESIAIKAFRYYEGSKSRKDMLMHLILSASDEVRRPIKDDTGQSINVDDKLGPAESYQRQKASATLRRIYNKLKLSDSETSVRGWREIFGDEV